MLSSELASNAAAATGPEAGGQEGTAGRALWPRLLRAHQVALNARRTWTYSRETSVLDFFHGSILRESEWSSQDIPHRNIQGSAAGPQRGRCVADRGQTQLVKGPNPDAAEEPGPMRPQQVFTGAVADQPPTPPKGAIVIYTTELTSPKVSPILGVCDCMYHRFCGPPGGKSQILSPQVNQSASLSRAWNPTRGN